MPVTLHTCIVHLIEISTHAMTHVYCTIVLNVSVILLVWIDTVERVILPLLQAGQYMLNYESTHCVALPLEYFRIPSAGNL